MAAGATTMLVCALMTACGAPKATPAPPPAHRAPPAASVSTPVLPREVKGIDYTENDFVESDRNRDPFRSFLEQNPAASRPQRNQRKVSLPQYSIDELKLIAIVQGSDQPRAMFVDPTGKGTVVYKGTFICRPEVVQMGGSGGPEYQLNWRVDRIRETDVVLIREDPTQPAIPPATRVVPLHPDADKEAAALAPG